MRTSKVALITGASRGLGRAMARRLAKDGFLIAAHYGASRGEAESLVEEIDAAGGQAVLVQADVSSLPEIDEMFDALDKELEAATGEPGIDVLINNAGVNEGVAFLDTSEESFDRIFATNVKGVFFVTQRAVPRLRDGGRVINLSSGLTRFSYPQYTAYSATKGAIEVFTRNLAAQLGDRGITVNAVSPGATDTDMNAAWLRSDAAQKQVSSVTALSRVGRAEDIADVVSFLAGPDSHWVTAQVIDATGGAHL